MPTPDPGPQATPGGPSQLTPSQPGADTGSAGLDPPLIGGGSSGSGSGSSGPSAGAATGQSISPTGIMQSLSTLLQDTAIAINFAFNMFKPGQGWRIVFGCGSLILFYSAFRLWVPSHGGISETVPAGMAGAAMA